MTTRYEPSIWFPPGRDPNGDTSNSDPGQEECCQDGGCSSSKGDNLKILFVTANCSCFEKDNDEWRECYHGMHIELEHPEEGQIYLYTYSNDDGPNGAPIHATSATGTELQYYEIVTTGNVNSRIMKSIIYKDLTRTNVLYSKTVQMRDAGPQSENTFYYHYFEVDGVETTPKYI